MKSKLILFLLCVGCSVPSPRDEYYFDSYKKNDVNRIPIVKPYELYTAYCCEEWTMNKELEAAWGTPYFSIGSINFQRGYLSVYSPRSVDSYGLLNTHSGDATFFSNRATFDSACAQLSISNEVYAIATLYKAWTITGQLPWAQEILSRERLVDIKNSDN